MGPRDRFFFRTLVPRSARRADRVLTVSERTKRDLVERYDIAEGKIVVTPNGVDPIFRPERRRARASALRPVRGRDPAAQGSAERRRGARAC